MSDGEKKNREVVAFFCSLSGGLVQTLKGWRPTSRTVLVLGRSPQTSHRAQRHTMHVVIPCGGYALFTWAGSGLVAVGRVATPSMVVGDVPAIPWSV